MFPVNYLRWIYIPIRRFSSNKILSKNHYDSLEITPKATQTQIKDAYYKLSMLYHPDKNTENASAVEKFRDITEAYEVLGNVRLRRLYDKGISHIADETVNQFYKSRERRTRPPATGRTPIYDFDEWSRAHYGAVFAKEREWKRRRELHKTAVVHEAQTVQMGRIILVMAVVFMVVTLSSKWYDLDRINSSNQHLTRSE